MDLDGFKDLNDTHGHEAGNHLLASVGAVSYDPRSRYPGDVLETADRALYRAKAAGGNRVVFGDRNDETEPRVFSLRQ